MEYISSKEAAIQWNISERLVQRYCLENRIEGARKFGHYWMIPAKAQKPQKLRKKDVGNKTSDRKNTNNENQYPIDDTCIVSIPDWNTPGEAENVLLALSGETACLFEMELAYYRGQAKLAQNLARNLLDTAKYKETRLACLQIIALSAVYQGSFLDWTEAHQRIYALASWRPEAAAMKELAIASVRLTFIDLSTVPKWLINGDFDRLPEIGSFQSIFTYIKYLQFTYKYELALHLTKITLTRKEFRENPVTRSYLELTLAALTHNLNDDESAKAHIRAALKYILPDGLYGIMVESLGWIDSLFDSVMLEDNLINQRTTILRIYEQYKAGWIKLGRHIIGEQWTVQLTPREWSALKYVAMGLSTAEISKNMCVSTESVKKYLSSIYHKLNIKGRNDIKSLLPLYGSGESDKTTHFLLTE